MRYQIYKVQAQQGSFGKDIQKAYSACAVRSNGKPLGGYTAAYTQASNDPTIASDDCAGKVVMFQAASMPGSDQYNIRPVWRNDVLIGNINSCQGHAGGRYFVSDNAGYQDGSGPWVGDVPLGAKVISAVQARVPLIPL